jgi:tetratricopeptide (TPR) repeat protein
LRKKHGKIQKHQNVIVFPGMVDRLISDGLKHAEDFQYDLAVKSIRQALTYREADEQTLGVFAYSLYETREFEEAKLVCQELLKIGPTYYFETIELYVTILMELREFEEMEQILSAVIDEATIPHDKVEKFQQLLELGSKLSKQKNNQYLTDEPKTHQIDATIFEIHTFSRFSEDKQQQLLVELEGSDLSQVEDELVDIVEHDLLSPITKSFALLLMVHTRTDREMTIEKFGRKATINPISLSEPAETQVVLDVLNLVKERLIQNPSKLDMVEDLILRHSFATYPFDWFEHDSATVGNMYIDYVSGMLGEDVTLEGMLYDFIIKIDILFELREM